MQLGSDNEATLEGFIDTYGLASILESIESICYSKAEHLRMNWQDEGQAKLWEEAAKALLNCNATVVNSSPVDFTKD